MTKKEFVRAMLAKAKKRKKVKYDVEKILENMNEEDLYCTSVKQSYCNDGDKVY